jgi:hypothetical protein
LAGHFEEDGHTAEHEAQGTPEILDDKVFHDAVVETPSKDAVDMLDQRKIALVQCIFLRLMAMVQCHFFTIVNQP